MKVALDGGSHLRILHVAKKFAGVSGGDAVVVENLRVEQLARGDEVVVLTSNCAAIHYGAGVLKTGLPIAPAQIDEVNVRRILSLAWLALTSFVLLRRLRPNVIHVHAIDMGVAMSMAAHVWRIPIVITLHGSSIGQAELIPAKNRVERILIRLAHYQRVITVDPSLLDEIRALNKNPPVYLPNTIRPTLRKSSPPARVDSQILYVGRLQWIKGADILLDAFRSVLESVPDAVLRLVGSGAEAAALKQQANDLVAGGRVVFCDERNRDEVADEMSKASIFVLPSRYEGFPLVLLESWAAGLPVIATAVGAIPKVIVDGVDGVLVAPQDPAALAACLVHLLSSAALRRDLGAAGRARIEGEFSINHAAAALTGIYREAIAAAGARS